LRGIRLARQRSEFVPHRLRGLDLLEADLAFEVVRLERVAVFEAKRIAHAVLEDLVAFNPGTRGYAPGFSSLVPM